MRSEHLHTTIAWNTTTPPSRPTTVHELGAFGLGHQLCDHASELPLPIRVKTLKKFATAVTDEIIIQCRYRTIVFVIALQQRSHISPWLYCFVTPNAFPERHAVIVISVEMSDVMAVASQCSREQVSLRLAGESQTGKSSHKSVTCKSCQVSSQ